MVKIKKNILVVLCGIVFIFVATALRAQSFEFKGQLVGWTNLFDREQSQVQTGLRYLPTFSFSYPVSENSNLDLELTTNVYGNLLFEKNRSTIKNNNYDFYRYWIRYSTNQLELRLGNQKINFGTAKLLRALMWFDRIDPRDLVKLTQGVKSLLLRYYFLNNTNIWIWGLYDNPTLKGLEFIPTKKNGFEFGGRCQYPLLSGEGALTYHHRVAEIGSLVTPFSLNTNFQPFKENRFALDGQWDLGIGLWFESVLINYDNNFLREKWQKMVTLGLDYTLPIGNGLHVMGEYFIQAFSESPLASSTADKYSAWSLNYPFGLLDRLSMISFYDWQTRNFYQYFNWGRTYDSLSLNFSLFVMPDQANLYSGGSYSSFGGNGVQIILMYNH